jgi:hypothetical protein
MRIRTFITVTSIVFLFGCTQERDATEGDPVVADNEELLKLYEQDQEDRSGEVDWSVAGPRDEQRRIRVMELINASKVRTSNDYLHAAMVFQHGADTTAARLAHSLAQTAVDLDPTNDAAKWLTAAAWDRYMMRLGEPQWYGTQFVRGPDGSWELYEVDSIAVTDEMRRELGVPSLAESRKRVKKYNR